MLLRFIRRLIVGVVPLLPAYAANLGLVFALNSLVALPPGLIASTALLGSLTGYALNTYLAPHFLRYYLWTGYYTKEEITTMTRRTR